MKKVLFLATLFVSIICFSACSDDDGGFDLNQIEGTWGLIKTEGYYVENGNKVSVNLDYNPFDPKEDDQKIVIKKISDNKYNIITYYYTDSKWLEEENSNFSLDGKTMIPEDLEELEFENSKLLNVTQEQLIMETTVNLTDIEGYAKATFKRMK